LFGQGTVGVFDDSSAGVDPYSNWCRSYFAGVKIAALLRIFSGQLFFYNCISDKKAEL
jgi:hypothetical protein